MSSEDTRPVMSDALYKSDRRMRIAMKLLVLAVGINSMLWFVNAQMGFTGRAWVGGLGAALSAGLLALLVAGIKKNSKEYRRPTKEELK